MPTGPEHFAQAEQYLKQVNNAAVGGKQEQRLLGLAHAHAMLAQAAATVELLKDQNWEELPTGRPGDAWRSAMELHRPKGAVSGE